MFLSQTNRIRGFLRQSTVDNLVTAVMVAVILVFPSQPQLRRGSLVVSVASNRADYVVIGAESRASNFDGNFVDDRSCKVISLDGDTLFYETGSNKLAVFQGEAWSSNGTARAVYGFVPRA